MRGVSNEPFGNYLSTWLKSYLVIIAATSSLAPAIASAAQSLPDQLAAALGGNMATSFDSFVSNAINPAQTIHDNMEPWTIDIWLTEYTITNTITLIVPQIGRASGRERVCQCGEISVVDVKLKKKIHK